MGSGGDDDDDDDDDDDSDDNISLLLNDDGSNGVNPNIYRCVCLSSSRVCVDSDGGI